MRGEVVRAQRGERHRYAPIDTPLAPTSHPVDVVAGFLTLHAFRTIYIADLDAIEGKGNHSSCIAQLEAAFPEVAFWVDAGLETKAQAAAWLNAHRSDLVLGSESLCDPALYENLAEFPRALLSLDFRGDDFQGPVQLGEDESLWPSRIIAMTLARVGSHVGPDFDQLGSIRDKAGKHRAIYAAGGVRGPEDLALLAKVGVAGVLVASALHDGRITREDL